MTEVTKKLFIGGISWDTSDELFREYFLKFGDLDDALIMRDRADGKSRGFGFVTFKDVASAQKVLVATGLELDGRKLDPKPAVPRDQMGKGASGTKGEPTRTCKVFVGGLSLDTNKEDLQGYFSKFGKVTEAMIMLDRDSGRPRGFGFVTFEDEETADKVVLCGSHSLRNKPVECKKAVPKAEAPPPIRASNSGNYNGYNRSGTAPITGYGNYYGQQQIYGYGYEDQPSYDAYSGYTRGFNTIPTSSYPRTIGDVYGNIGYYGYGEEGSNGSYTTGYEQAYTGGYSYGSGTTYPTNLYAYGTGYPGYDSYASSLPSLSISTPQSSYKSPYT